MRVHSSAVMTRARGMVNMQRKRGETHRKRCRRWRSAHTHSTGGGVGIRARREAWSRSRQLADERLKAAEQTHAQHHSRRDQQRKALTPAEWGGSGFLSDRVGQRHAAEHIPSGEARDARSSSRRSERQATGPASHRGQGQGKGNDRRTNHCLDEFPDVELWPLPIRRAGSRNR